MASHVGLLLVFSMCASIVFATLLRDDPGEQLRFGARLFGGFVGAGVALGWLLYPLPF